MATFQETFEQPHSLGENGYVERFNKAQDELIDGAIFWNVTGGMSHD